MPIFPEAFRVQMTTKLGDQWAAFESVHDQPSPTSFRINPLKTTRPEQLRPVPWSATGCYLDERPLFTRLPNLHAGVFYVQEASSMFLEQAIRQTVDLSKAVNVLDLCAAPGGKSTHILSLLNEESMLVSNEVIRSRANILSENIQKWGQSNVVITSNDPHDFERVPGFFDVLVIDAPCSGEGLFRKDPEAMDAWSDDNVMLCARRQRRILQDVWPSLKEGAIIIYSTCTYNTHENEDNLDWLGEQHEVEFISLDVPKSWSINTVRKNKVIGYQLLPHNVEGEGFFLSAFRKLEGSDNVNMRRSSLTTPNKKTTESITPWLLNPEKHALFQHNDQVRFFPTSKISQLDYISHKLYILNAGTGLATLKHDKLVPEHGAALSVSLNKSNFQSIPLTLDQAIQYLKKESITPVYGQPGFALVEFENHPLGWVNLLQNRINNLYPAEWRIRN